VEHQSALEAAERAASPECEARALSGLGDAYYSQGRVITSLDYFRRCIALCQEHGFGRIAVGNQYMVAWIRLYLAELDGSRADAIVAVEAAERVGHQRAEMVARLTAGRTVLEMGEFAEADRHFEQGLDLAGQLGANRFKPFLMMHLARSWFIQHGPRGDITEMARQAVAISRETGIGFLGPWALAILALVDRDDAASRAALAEGETLLAGDCVGHNYFGFYPVAMEAARRLRDWDALERYAAALEAYSRCEPVPWSDFFVARGRALAAYGRGDRGDATMQEFERLRSAAERVGWATYLSSQEAALADAS